MDPLTHTLVGANLAASRLGRTTRCAAAALVLGANLPDVDVAAYFAGPGAALAFRRGWTHGLPALAIWPFVLTGLLVLWGRWRPRPGTPPLRSGRLLGLAGLALLTHPALDWLNNYGMRWLMPFDGGWTYGDSVFIMDPWLWLLLAGPWLLTRRRGWALLLAWTIAFALVGWLVGHRAPGSLPVVAVVALTLLVAWWIPPRKLGAWKDRLPVLGLAAGALWILGLIGLHAVAERRVREALEAADIGPVERLMVGPSPLDPGRWEAVVELPEEYRWGRFSLWRDDAGLDLDPSIIARPSPGRLHALAASDQEAQRFLVWARFPWLRERADGVMVLDARYARSARTGFGAMATHHTPD